MPALATQFENASKRLRLGIPTRLKISHLAPILASHVQASRTKQACSARTDFAGLDLSRAVDEPLVLGFLINCAANDDNEQDVRSKLAMLTDPQHIAAFAKCALFDGWSESFGKAIKSMAPAGNTTTLTQGGPATPPAATPPASTATSDLTKMRTPPAPPPSQTAPVLPSVPKVPPVPSTQATPSVEPVPPVDEMAERPMPKDFQLPEHSRLSWWDRNINGSHQPTPEDIWRNSELTRRMKLQNQRRLAEHGGTLPTPKPPTEADFAAMDKAIQQNNYERAQVEQAKQVEEARKAQEYEAASVANGKAENSRIGALPWYQQAYERPIAAAKGIGNSALSVGGNMLSGVASVPKAIQQHVAAPIMGAVTGDPNVTAEMQHQAKTLLPGLTNLQKATRGIADRAATDAGSNMTAATSPEYSANYGKTLKDFNRGTGHAATGGLAMAGSVIPSIAGLASDGAKQVGDNAREFGINHANAGMADLGNTVVQNVSDKKLIFDPKLRAWKLDRAPLPAWKDQGGTNTTNAAIAEQQAALDAGNPGKAQTLAGINGAVNAGSDNMQQMAGDLVFGGALGKSKSLLGGVGNAVGKLPQPVRSVGTLMSAGPIATAAGAALSAQNNSATSGGAQAPVVDGQMALQTDPNKLGAPEPGADPQDLNRRYQSNLSVSQNEANPLDARQQAFDDAAASKSQYQASIKTLDQATGGQVSAVMQAAPEVQNQIKDSIGSYVQKSKDLVNSFTALASGKLDPKQVDTGAAGKLATEFPNANPKSLWDTIGQLDMSQKILLGGGLSLAAVGAISALSGEGGIMSWIMGLLGLGGAALGAASGGLLGSGAKDFASGITGAFTPQKGQALSGFEKGIINNAPSWAMPHVLGIAAKNPALAKKLDMAAGIGGGNGLLSFVGDMTGETQRQFTDAGVNAEQIPAILQAWKEMRQQKQG